MLIPFLTRYGGLKRAQFLDALEERLSAPLREAGQLAVLGQFREQFDGVTFTKVRDRP